MAYEIATQARREPTLTQLQAGLSEKQLRFAELRARGFSLRKSAMLAGYEAANDVNFTSIGYRLSHDERIVALLEHYGRQAIRAAAPRAAEVLDKIMSSPTAKDADRIKAGKVLLDKSVPSRTEHNVAGQFSHEHVHEHRAAPSLDDLRREAGLLPAPRERVTDAVFVEVIGPVEPAQPEGGDPVLRGGDEFTVVEDDPDPSEWEVE